MQILIRKPISIRIGSLGKLKFSEGKYIYVGSAQTGLENRVARHLRHRKKKFWHIDYLLNNPNVSVDRILCKEAHKEEECKTATLLSKYGKSVPGFGSSDCKCESHLFILKSNFSNNMLSRHGFCNLT